MRIELCSKKDRKQRGCIHTVGGVYIDGNKNLPEIYMLLIKDDLEGYYTFVDLTNNKVIRDGFVDIEIFDTTYPNDIEVDAKLVVNN